MRSLITGLLHYTERETAWLEHVVLHAGVFLRRQYLAFIGHRGRGAVDQRFLARLAALRHAAVLPYHHRECVFHLTSKPLYEWFNHADLRHRRPLAPHRLAQKLMLLDVTLHEREHRWLATEEDKVRFFRGACALPEQVLPRRVYRSGSAAADTTRYFVDRFSILVHADGRVGFVYPDFSGHTDVFAAFLKDHSLLLRSLPAAEVVFVTGQRADVARAEAKFRREFGLSAQANCNLITELSDYCATRQALDEHQYGRLRREALDRHPERQKRFEKPEYEPLYRAWIANGTTGLIAAFEEHMRRPAPLTFRHLALPYRYYCLGREASRVSVSAGQRDAQPSLREPRRTRARDMAAQNVT